MKIPARYKKLLRHQHQRPRRRAANRAINKKWRAFIYGSWSVLEWKKGTVSPVQFFLAC